MEALLPSRKLKTGPGGPEFYKPSSAGGESRGSPLPSGKTAAAHTRSKTRSVSPEHVELVMSDLPGISKIEIDALLRLLGDELEKLMMNS